MEGIMSSGPDIVQDEVSESIDWVVLSLCFLSLLSTPGVGGVVLAGS